MNKLAVEIRVPSLMRKYNLLVPKGITFDMLLQLFLELLDDQVKYIDNNAKLYMIENGHQITTSVLIDDIAIYDGETFVFI